MKSILNLIIGLAFCFIGYLAFGGIIAYIGYEGAGILFGIIFIILLTIIINLLMKINSNIEKLKNK
ncbi:hypothetical protein [Psychrobacillus soli]|uniref:Uncharacterized protein n=1 Tax=Psychrobacillus soli TaxID=1543965 RepID=A0A544TDK8_9BACI|nr:hypothetical protein [Psychrobacillus soli]TQR15547.1 hypothetical protein FG383_08040 [Psychrobacillus soli]